MGLRCRHVISVNQAVDSYIELEGRAIHRLTGVALHRRDVVSVDNATLVYVAQQYTHRYRNVSCVGAVAYVSQRDGDVLRVWNAGAIYGDDAAVNAFGRWLSATRG